MSCWNRSWTLLWGPAESPLSWTTARGGWLEAVPAAPSTPLCWGWGPSCPSWAAGPCSVPARCTSSHCPPAVPCPCLSVLPLVGVPHGSLPLGSSRCCCPAGAQTTLTATSLLLAADSPGPPQISCSRGASSSPSAVGRLQTALLDARARWMQMAPAGLTLRLFPASQRSPHGALLAVTLPVPPQTSPEPLGRGTAGL